MKKSILTFLVSSLLITGFFISCSPSAEVPPFNGDAYEEYSMLKNYPYTASGIRSCILPEDPVFAKWPQYKKALADVHGEVYALSLLNYDGSSSLLFKDVYVEQESSISFDYKLDFYSQDYLALYIDDVKVMFETGEAEMWKKSSFNIPAGTHKIEFKAERTSGFYSLSNTNSVYLDNIHIIPNETVSVDISPKGKQETYVGGFPIQFSANALRKDKSIRDGRKVTWSCTGGTITQDGLFTPGTTAENCTVTATIDGITESNSTVIVHGTDYLNDSVTINGHTFNGYSGAVTSGVKEMITFEQAPVDEAFSADGFFTIKGRIDDENADNYAIIVVSSGDYSYTQFVHEDFYERIWLRFGTDKPYTVSILQLTKRPDMKGEFFSNWNYWNRPRASWTVKNTHKMEDAMYLMPSSICQSDNFLVSNVVNNILATLPENATIGQKMQACYDWETRLLHYDNVSVIDDGKYRKAQDAYSVVKNEMAVCEGYANLYASLVRSFGVKTRYNSAHDPIKDESGNIIKPGMAHGWVECFYGKSWQLVDATWDDPLSSSAADNVEKYPYRELYNYFLISTSGINNDHYGYKADPTRSAEEELIPPSREYYFDGWY